MKDLEKLMASKPEGKMDKTAIQAKMDVIQELLEMTQSAMAGRVKGGMDDMQKASVVEPEKTSLADLAEAMGDEGPDEDAMDHNERMDEESSESVDEPEEVETPMSEEEPVEEVSPFMKKGSADKRKKLFSMSDED